MSWLSPAFFLGLLRAESRGAARLLSRPLVRFAGDMAALGKGEIFFPRNGHKRAVVALVFPRSRIIQRMIGGGPASISRTGHPAMIARRDRFLALLGTRSVLMGILNITPDSFSDGGKFFSLEAALRQARKLARDGADIIDVGAESTRPGHTPVEPEEELARLEPILGGSIHSVDLPFSIDTSKAEVARRAMELGASVINDVWGLQTRSRHGGHGRRNRRGGGLMHNRDGRRSRSRHHRRHAALFRPLIASRR